MSSSQPTASGSGISQGLMESYKAGRIFSNACESGRSITSLSFDESGESLVTASNDDAFKLWSCRSGKHRQTFYSKKYGIDHVRFTHTKSNIMHASTRVDDAVRYHDLFANKYISYFKGHTDKVLSVEINPILDTFVTSSADQSVRLWDLREPHCAGFIHAGFHPVVAWDNTGLLFAVAVNGANEIHMYDPKKFESSEGGPFSIIPLDDTAALSEISRPPRTPLITSLTFSTNGKLLLVGTSGDVHYILDAFWSEHSNNQPLLRRLVGHQGLERDAMGKMLIEPQVGSSGEEVRFTPDSKFVIAGSWNGNLVVWSMEGVDPSSANGATLRPLTMFEGHSGPLNAVGYNPKFHMMASGANELAFWLPERDLNRSET